MKSLFNNAKCNLKKRAVLLAVLAFLAAACFVGAVLTPALKTSVYAADVSEYIKSAIENTKEYSSETEIVIDNSDDEAKCDYVITSGKRIRFTGASEHSKITFSGNITVEQEAVVILDAEAEFARNVKVDVKGTLIINGRLLNNSELEVANVKQANAEIESEGVVINGSLNNDAGGGGSIRICDGATLLTSASTQTYRDANGEQTLAGGGTLMLKAGGNGLGLSGNILNNGSVVYDGGAAAPHCTGNAPVQATFEAASASVFGKSGTYAVYGNATVDSAQTLNNKLNLIAFGKVEYKLGGENINIAVTDSVSLGGGVENGITFTQGANELIFDGGAQWEKGNTPEYGNITATTTVFYGDDNLPYIYTNNGISHNGAFFNVSVGTLSTYGGTKITNFENSSSERGGGVNVAAGAEINMYGGEISRNAVTARGNDGTGAGIYTNGGAVNLYGGKVTHNAATSYFKEGSADGAGIAIDPSGVNSGSEGRFNLYGGEVSYNHGAVGLWDVGADGGGIMLRFSKAVIYGGEIRGNFTGGSGGGIGAWNATVEMHGGTIAGNRAAFGGGIAAVANNKSEIKISGGYITGNEAFQNYTAGSISSENLRTRGGYGGGICVGSSQNSTKSTVEFSGDAVVSGNKAFRGGGLAVYTKSDGSSNQLIMEGGSITGNGAYELTKSSGYIADYTTPKSANGGGVYVNCDGNYSYSRAMLELSGNATIDSSNSVSIGAGGVSSGTGTSTSAPIEVTGDLTGNGLGALVYLDTSNSIWNGKNIIKFTSSAAAAKYLNKFVLDSTQYAFKTNGNYLNFGTGSTVAKITAGGAETQFGTLDEAFEAIESGTVSGESITLEVLQSTTVSRSLTIPAGRTVTIIPSSGEDTTVALASSFGISSAQLFTVPTDSTLIINGGDGSASRLTFDGNGTGRMLENGNVLTRLTLVNIDGGTYGQRGNTYLRNNRTSGASSAVLISENGGVFNMENGVIEANTSTISTGGAIYLNGGTFNWSGGTIRNNITENQNATANYGIYLSAGTLNIDNTVNLIDNVVRVSPRPTIYVGANFDFRNSSDIQLEFPSRSELQAGTNVVRVKTSENIAGIAAKFTIAGTQEGITLKSSQNNSSDSAIYPYNIVLYKTVTYLLNANQDGVSRGDDGALSEIVAEFTATEGVTVRTRNGGKVLAVQVPYGSTSATLEKVSNFYTKTGETLMSWQGGGSDRTYQYNGRLPYEETSNDYIELEACYEPNIYTLAFNSNSPDGAAVSGAMGTQTINITGTSNTTVSANKFIVKGFVFTGWALSSDGGKVLDDGADIAGADVRFSGTDTRGTYRLTVFAVWQNLFGGGVGTSANPFIISDAIHLANLRDTVNGDEISNYYNMHADGGEVSFGADSYESYYFRLEKDIEFAGGIGRAQNTPFSGNFNGNSTDGIHTVTIKNSDGAGAGLFGYLSNAVISGLNIAGSVTGTDNVGALAGYVSGGSITNVSNTATVTATGNKAGGIAGYASGVQITDCYNAGSVTGKYKVGGIIGEYNGAYTVSNVFNAGAVNATGYADFAVTTLKLQFVSRFSFAGGIAGSMSGNTSDISNAFNSGTVTAAYGGAGGIIGVAEATGKSINNSYNTGTVSAQYMAGGLAGYIRLAQISYSFNGGSVKANGTFSYTAASSGEVDTGKKFAGAIAGIGGQLSIINVYYNTDKEYVHSDVSIKAAGDAVYSVDSLGFLASSDNSVALTSSRMFVPLDGDGNGTSPAGFDQLFNTGSWEYVAEENYEFYYYPQLAVFTQNQRVIDGNTVARYSAESAKLKVSEESEEKPLTPSVQFKVMFVLGEGQFNAAMQEKYSYDSANDRYYTAVSFKDVTNLTLEEPDAPSRVGYTFMGWFLDGDYNVEYKFKDGYSVDGLSAADITLYAKWDITRYSFQYGRDGGTFIQNAEYASYATLGGGMVILATGETESNENDAAVVKHIRKNGYNFIGWTYNYDSNGTVKPLYVDAVEIVMEGTEPVVKFYKKDGSNYAELPEKVKLSAINNFEFDAKWIERDYKIQFGYFVDRVNGAENTNADDWETFKEQVINGNRFEDGQNYSKYTYSITEVHKIETASSKGYTFVNWYIKNDDGTYGVYNSIPAGAYGNRTVYGLFIPDSIRVTFYPGDDGTLDGAGLEFERDSLGGYYTYFPYGCTPDGDIAGIEKVEANKTGYAFTGWFTNRESQDEQFRFNFNEVFKPEAGFVNLFAFYDINTYKVTVNAGSGEFKEQIKDGFSLTDGVTIDGQSTSESLTLTVRHGTFIYEALTILQNENNLRPALGTRFVSWQDDGSKDHLTNFLVTEEGLSITAQYSADQVTIIFTNDYKATEGAYKNFHVMVIEPEIKDAEGNVTQQAYKLTKADIENISAVASQEKVPVTGYAFRGWAINGEIKNIEVGTTFDDSYRVVAVYEPVEVNIVFEIADACTDDGLPAPETEGGSRKFNEYFGSLITVPVYNGFEFAGWKVKGTDISVTSSTAVSSVYDGSGTVTLTGAWTEIDYRISYNLGAAEVKDGVTLKSQYTYSQTWGGGFELDGADVLVLDGYKLVGWYLGGVELTDNRLPAGTYGDITLTPRYELEKYTVTFDAGEGFFLVPADYSGAGVYYNVKENGKPVSLNNAAGQAAKYYDTLAEYLKDAIAPSAPLKNNGNGYLFGGWDGVYYSVTGDRTVTAKYAIQSYTVYLWANGSSFAGGTSGATLSVGYGEVVLGEDAVELPRPDPREGYTFAGWAESANGTALMQKTMPAENLELYAVWEANVYAVKMTFGEIDGQDGVELIKKYFDENKIYFKDQSYTLDEGTVSFEVYHNTDLSALNSRPGNYIWYRDGQVYAFGLITASQDITASKTVETNAIKVTLNLYGKTSYDFYYAENAVIQFPEVSRGHYKFTGWYSKAQGEAGAEQITGTVKATENATYYAHWEAVEYTVTLNYAGGTGSKDKIEYTVNTAVLELPSSAEVTRRGYDFDGWYATGEESAFAYVQGTTTGDKILTAKWTAKKYKITVEGHEVNSGGGITASVTVTYGESGENAQKLFSLWSRDYYTVNIVFDGTAVGFDERGQGSIRALDSVYEGVFSVEKDADGCHTATVKITYTPISYNMLYRSEDGSLIATETYDFNTREYVLEREATKTGHDFRNWSTTVNDSVVEFDKFTIKQNDRGNWILSFEFEGKETATLTMGDTLLLYPLFDTRVYEVTFEANGGSGAMDAQKFTYGVTDAISKNKFTRKGYTFTGWKKAVYEGQNEVGTDGGTIYPDLGALTLTDELTSGQTVKLIAQWAPVTYRISFIADGGTITGNSILGGTSLILFTYDEVKDGKVITEFDVPVATGDYMIFRTGYSFAGWKIGSEYVKYVVGTDNTVSFDQIMDKADHTNTITLTADWTAVKYNVTYELGGGVWKAEEGVKNYLITSVTINLSEVEKTGYTFGGWTANGVFVGKEQKVDLTKYPSLFTDGGNTITFTANWTAHTYTVVFDANGATGTAGSQTFTYGVSQNLNLNTFIKTGYSFGGWLFDGNTYADGASVTNLTSVNGATVTLSAVWKANTYTVTFNGNGATGAMEPQEFAYDEPQNLTPNSFRLTGYIFKGWATSHNGEIMYVDGEQVENLTVSDGGSVILYAVWEAATYNVKFDVNTDDLDNPSDATLSYGGNSSLTLPAPERKGYTFLGWKAGGVAYTGNVYLTSALIECADGSTHTITFTAEWSAPVQYTVSYARNDGIWKDGAGKTQYTVTDGEYTVPQIERKGYTFLGWFDNAEYTGNAIEVIQADWCRDLVLYAKWEIITFNVVISAGQVNGTAVRFIDGKECVTLENVKYGDDIYSSLIELQGKIDRSSMPQNYNFFGWVIDGKQMSEFSLKCEGDIEITAQYRQGTVSVTLIRLDGKSVFDEYELSASEGYVTPDNAHSDLEGGYKTLGWYLYGTQTEYVTAKITSSMVLQEFVKEGNEYTVTFAGNGGTFDGKTSYTQQFTFGTAKNLTNFFTYSGYEFKGWSETQDGEVVYTDGQSVSDVAGDMTLYAKWGAIVYTYMFDLNGGSGNVSSSTISLDGANTDIELSKVVKLGNLFNGWKTGGIVISSDKVALSDVLGSASANNVITFTADWTPVEYTVITDGVALDGTYTIDGELTLTDPAVQKGYSFLGWSNEENGAVIIKNGNSVNVLSVILGALPDPVSAAQTINLYTISQAISYKVRFNSGMQGVSDPSEVQISYAVQQQSITLPSIGRIGYDFLGWYSAGESVLLNGVKTLDDIIDFADKDNVISLNAKWSAPLEYSVVFYDENGTNVLYSPSDKFTVVNGAFDYYNAKKNGYNLVGWLSSNNTLITSWNSIADLIAYADGNNTVILKAHWSDPVTYTVRYENLLGGTHGNPLTFNVTTQTITLGGAVRDNFDFEGWFAEASFDNRVYEITTGSYGNKVLYAKWKVKSFEITSLSIDDWMYGEPAKAVKYETTGSNRSFVNISYAKLGAHADSGAVDGTWIDGQGELTFDALASYPGAGTYVVRAFYEIEGVKASADAYFVFNITKRSVAKPALVNTQFIYNGNEIRAEISGYVSSVMTSDDVRTEGEKAFATGTVVKSYTVTFRLQNTDNYVWSGEDGAAVELSWSISKAEDDEITVMELPQIEIDGVSVPGIVYGSGFGYFARTRYGGDITFCHKPAGKAYPSDNEGWISGFPVNVGEYVMIAVSEGNDNFGGTQSEPFTFVVGKKTLRVTVNGTGVYGDDFDDALFGELIFNGFADGDSADNLDIGEYKPVLINTRGTRNTAGSYALTLKLGSDGFVDGITAENYNIVAEHGTFVITPRPITVTIGSASSVYTADLFDLNGNIQTLVTVSEGGLAQGDTLADLGISLITTATRLSDAGGYSIRISGYTTDNYSISSTEGVYTVTPLTVGVVFNNGGGTYGNVTPLAIEDFDIADAAQDKIDLIKEQLLSSLVITYAGAANDGTPYHGTEVPVPAGSYVAFAELSEDNDNYRLTNILVSFTIEKADDSLVSDIRINGWTYGNYSAEINTPVAELVSGTTAVTFTYSDSEDGDFTAALPSSWNAGKYWVRAEAADSYNFNKFVSKPVEFTISRVRLDDPVLTVIVNGAGKNDVYTGSQLQSAIVGFDSTLMRVASEGALVDGNNVTLVAVNAGTYTARITLINPENYVWSTGKDVLELCWTVAKQKVAKPAAITEQFKVTGAILTYIPVGFNENLMTIEGNRAYFNGSYVAIVSLIDTDNFEWEDGTSGSLEYVWDVVGISTLFIVLVSVISSLAGAALVFAGVQYAMYERRKRMREKAIDERSAKDEAEASGEGGQTQSADAEQTDESGEQVLKNADGEQTETGDGKEEL